MEKLELVFSDNQQLREPSEHINEITSKLIQLAEDMKVAMVKYNGIGLAAPQVGHNIRLIVVRIGDEVYEMFNPQIRSHSGGFITLEEGCLSIPNEYCMVPRYETIKLKFQDKTSKYNYWEIKGLDARVVQHEVDHLDGILITDLVKENDQHPV